jgi:hypothetical protein
MSMTLFPGIAGGWALLFGPAVAILDNPFGQIGRKR